MFYSHLLVLLHRPQTMREEDFDDILSSSSIYEQRQRETVAISSADDGVNIARSSSFKVRKK